MSKINADELIRQKKAEIQAKLARLTQKTTALASNVPSTQQMQRAEANLMNPDVQRRIEEAKARMLANLQANPYLTKVAGQHPAVQQSSTHREAKGGLAIPIHPSLQNTTKGGQKTRANIPKAPFATVKANVRVAATKQPPQSIDAQEKVVDITKNPYYDPNLGITGPKQRGKKQLQFARQGRFIEEADRVRAQAQLDRLRQEIAENAKRVGMDVNLHISSDKSIRREPPPAVEWWDEILLVNGRYDDLDLVDGIKPTGDNMAISNLVQHPVPIEPVELGSKPQEIKLTKQEQKKLRRKNRLEAQKLVQDKIRLGLLPPEKSKVKMRNLMQVLMNEAVQDPTLMEARVRQEAQERHDQHLRANEDRKLTDEQRREKKINQLARDADKGIHVAVFKIRTLEHAQHRFKIDKNSKQLALTGVVVLNPLFALVVVEGGPKAIKIFTKLLLRRITWNPDEGDMEENECYLIWQGSVPTRQFHNFRFHLCPSETTVKEKLERHKAGHYWDLAKQYQPDPLNQDAQLIV